VTRGTRTKFAQTLSKAGLGDLANVKFHRVPTNEPWCRDHGPIFLTNPARENR